MEVIRYDTYHYTYITKGELKLREIEGLQDYYIISYHIIYP